MIFRILHIYTAFRRYGSVDGVGDLIIVRMFCRMSRILVTCLLSESEGVI